MTIPLDKVSGSYDAHQARPILAEGTHGSPAHEPNEALPQGSYLPPQLDQAVNRGRLLVLAGLALLLLLGTAGREQPATLSATLSLAILFAGGREWALRKRHRPWLSLAASAMDGLTAAALVYTSGGPSSSLDVLFPVAILALAAQPAPAAALGLAILDTWLYVPAVLWHPTYTPTQHLGSLASRLLLFSLLGVGACVVARAGARRRREVELAQQRWRRESEEVERVRHAARGRANLIAMLSHDLRTPLTSVKGFAQLLLRDRSTSETAQRYAKVIVAETNRAILTIGDAVDLTRVQCGRGALHFSSVDLRPIIEAAVAALDHHDLEGRIHLNLQGPLPLVRADPSKVERIMVHLISNTLRYSQGSGPVEVGASADVAGVVVWVQNGGGGIPPEKFAHIFDLETDDCEDEGEFNGSGLGLYISKHLVEAHGGRMWVESADGHGSRFAFRLQS